MLQMIEANWVAFVIALLVGIVVAWWIFARGSGGDRPREHRPDVLDEGAAPAQRNQALIDAPPAAASVSTGNVMADPVVASATTAAAFAGTGPDIMGGIGEIVGAAAAEEVAEETARHDEELLHKEPPVHVPPPAKFGGEPDDLKRIKGVGPKLDAQLKALGITHFHQIAGWNDADIDRIDAQLGAFAGRPRRDGWVEQARLLASGDTTGYEAKFGKL